MLTETLLKVALLGAEWVLYLLVLLSVISIAVTIERAIVFARSRRTLLALEREVLRISDGSSSAAAVAQGSREVRLLEAFSEALAGGKEMVSGDGGNLLASQVQGLAAAYRRYLERGNAILGTLGNNAPFIGLLGTVIGVIQAFYSLQTEMEGSASSVMAGISEALVATAAGLFVAIPAVVAFNYFTKVSQEFVERFETLLWSRVKGERSHGSK